MSPVFIPDPFSYLKTSIVFQTLSKTSIEYRYYFYRNTALKETLDESGEDQQGHQTDVALYKQVNRHNF